MTMNFPDMNSLMRAANAHKFRHPERDESEEDYREALADHVEDSDLIESMEIRTGHGWNQFTDKEKDEMVKRGLLRTMP